MAAETPARIARREPLSEPIRSRGSGAVTLADSERA